MKPSKVVDNYWIYARRKKGSYRAHTARSGKWLIFVPADQIDKTWEIVKQATIKGTLGEVSKVATALENPNAKDHNIKVICVYTYDYEDKEDVYAIRNKLFELGFTNKLVYKSDQATSSGKYGHGSGIYYK
jgi:hypothetical protein